MENGYYWIERKILTSCDKEGIGKLDRMGWRDQK